MVDFEVLLDVIVEGWGAHLGTFSGLSSFYELTTCLVGVRAETLVQAFCMGSAGLRG